LETREPIRIPPYFDWRENRSSRFRTAPVTRNVLHGLFDPSSH
jgi:hypothetical protein